MPSKRTPEKELQVSAWVANLAAYYNFAIQEQAVEFWLHELCEWSFKPVKPTAEVETAAFQKAAWKELSRRATQRHSRMPMIADLLEIYDEMREELERQRNTEHMREITKEE
jgi:hypothetical protein